MLREGEERERGRGWGGGHLRRKRSSRLHHRHPTTNARFSKDRLCALLLPRCPRHRLVVKFVGRRCWQWAGLAPVGNAEGRREWKRLHLRAAFVAVWNRDYCAFIGKGREEGVRVKFFGHGVVGDKVWKMEPRDEDG